LSHTEILPHSGKPSIGNGSAACGFLLRNGTQDMGAVLVGKLPPPV
jgi:hypothetical protein